MYCHICDKPFSGLVCFQQHEASEKHKNKVKLFQMRAANGATPTSASNMDSQIIHCHTCEVDFMGLSNFQKHVNSLQHVEMFKNKNESSGAESQLNCIPDESEHASSKKETNPVSYMALNSSSMMSGPYARCEVCKTGFTGPEPYQQHLASEKHKKKVIRNELFGKINFDTVDSDKIMPFIKQGNDSKNGASGSIEPYAECSFCNMPFSGPEPYQLHVDSEGHQKKVAAANLNSSIQSSGNQNNALNPYRCNVCDKDLSGPIPYNDHINGKLHKKKVQNMELLKSIGNPTASLSDSNTQVPHYLMQHIDSDLVTGDRAWYCEVCKKQSTGPIPHEMHIGSEGHRKNIRAMEMEKILHIKRESLMQPYLENKNDLKNEKVNELSKEDQRSSSTYNDKSNEVHKDFYISKDLILCDTLKNIGVISEEDLNIKIFYPDDEIVFA